MGFLLPRIFNCLHNNFLGDVQILSAYIIVLWLISLLGMVGKASTKSV